MEIREITFSLFFVSSLVLNHYNEMYVLYMFYMLFTLIVSVLCCQSVIPK